jgi:hypothetical protein
VKREEDSRRTGANDQDVDSSGLVLLGVAIDGRTKGLHCGRKDGEREAAGPRGRLRSWFDASCKPGKPQSSEPIRTARSVPDFQIRRVAREARLFTFTSGRVHRVATPLTSLNARPPRTDPTAEIKGAQKCSRGAQTSTTPRASVHSSRRWRTVVHRLVRLHGPGTGSQCWAREDPDDCAHSSDNGILLLLDLPVDLRLRAWIAAAGLRQLSRDTRRSRDAPICGEAVDAAVPLDAVAVADLAALCAVENPTKAETPSTIDQ